MPYAKDRNARLYYDDGCGPCRFFASAAAGLSRHRVRAIPLAAAAAEGDLAGLSAEVRYGSAHLVYGTDLRSGESITGPLVGLTLGDRWERVVRNAPFVDRMLRGAYRRAWEARRARGCGADTRKELSPRDPGPPAVLGP